MLHCSDGDKDEDSTLDAYAAVAASASCAMHVPSLSLSLSHQYSTRVSNHISPTITIYICGDVKYIYWDTHTRTPSYMQCKISLTVLLPLTRRGRETRTPTAFTLLEKGDMNEQCAVCLSLASVASLLALLCFPPFRAQRNGVKRVCGERLQYTISIATILHHPIDDDDDDKHTLFRPSCLACTYIVDPACVVVTCMHVGSIHMLRPRSKKKTPTTIQIHVLYTQHVPHADMYI
jgi:hypothetical protein